MNIIQKGSPNFTNGRGGNPIREFIIHWMAGNLASTDAVFQNRARNTSAHYGIEDDKIHQYVDIKNTAYHAGNWGVNQTSIGIEHSAQPGRNATDATYESSAQLIASIIKAGHTGKSYRKHSAIVATQCPGTIDIDRIANRVNEILGGSAPVVTPSPTPPAASKWATVTVLGLNVRAQPTSKSPLAGSKTLKQGDKFEYTELVKGEMVNGVSTWIKSKKGNYVWAGGTNLSTPAVAQPAPPRGGWAQAIRTSNVRVAPNTSAALGGSQRLNPGDKFQYSAKVYGQWVNQNGVNTNVWYHSLKGNYVWAGNIKDI